MEGLQKNDILESLCDGLTSEGLGVCRAGGRAVFVRGALPGERWRLRVEKVGRGACYGKGLACLAPSPDRAEPACPHFGRCGGCATMHMSYEAELRHKLARVNDAFARIGGLALRAAEIVPAPAVQGYRNKAVYAVGERDGRPVFGFFRAGSHEVVPVSRCLLQSAAADACARAVTDWMAENGVPAYDHATGRGAVRHVFTRVARDGSAVCCVVSAAGLGARTAGLAPALRTACPQLTGVVLNINKTRGNTVLAGDFYTLWGEAALRDRLCGHVFELAPRAFYQVNPPQAERLYALAVDMADPGPADTVLDLYCGAGTISLALAGRAGRVVGAELVPEAVANAAANAAANGVANAEFLCADAGEAARALRARGVSPAAVVVDPPRKGMDEAAVEAVAAMAPRRVVYVSCDPATLARDLARFQALGYDAQRAVAVDMFPRTMHVEMVCLLSREAYPPTIGIKMEVETGEAKEHPTYERIQGYVEEKYGFEAHTANIAEVKRMCGLGMHHVKAGQPL